VELERIVLGLLIRHPFLADRFGERIAGLQFASAPHQALALMIMEASAEGPADAPAALLGALPERARMCLNEVWGEPGDPAGPRLLRRFPVLSYQPDVDFVSRCAELFLMKLELREAAAELDNAAQQSSTASDPAHEERLRSLFVAVEAHRSAITELERTVDDAAALLRRRKTTGHTERPSDKLL